MSNPQRKFANKVKALHGNVAARLGKPFVYHPNQAGLGVRRDGGREAFCKWTVTMWDPHATHGLEPPRCPHCNSKGSQRDGWCNSGPRRVMCVAGQEYVWGVAWRCQAAACRRSFLSYHHDVVRQLTETDPHVAKAFRFVLTKKQGVTTDVLSMMHGLVGTVGSPLSFEKLASALREMHQNKWLHAFSLWSSMVHDWKLKTASGGVLRGMDGHTMSATEAGGFRDLGAWDDPCGYAGRSPKAPFLVSLYISEYRRNEHLFNSRLLQVPVTANISLDLSFKLPPHISVSGGHPFKSCLSVLNEFNQVIAFKLLKGSSLKEVMPDLQKLGRRNEFWRQKLDALVAQAAGGVAAPTPTGGGSGGLSGGGQSNAATAAAGADSAAFAASARPTPGAPQSSLSGSATAADSEVHAPLEELLEAVDAALEATVDPESPIPAPLLEPRTPASGPICGRGPLSRDSVMSVIPPQISNLASAPAREFFIVEVQRRWLLRELGGEVGGVLPADPTYLALVDLSDRIIEDHSVDVDLYFQDPLIVSALDSLRQRVANLNVNAASVGARPARDVLSSLRANPGVSTAAGAAAGFRGSLPSRILGRIGIFMWEQSRAFIERIWTDNCCHDKNLLYEAFPSLNPNTSPPDETRTSGRGAAGEEGLAAGTSGRATAPRKVSPASTLLQSPAAVALGTVCSESLFQLRSSATSVFRFMIPTLDPPNPSALLWGLTCCQSDLRFLISFSSFRQLCKNNIVPSPPPFSSPSDVLLFLAS